LLGEMVVPEAWPGLLVWPVPVEKEEMGGMYRLDHQRHGVNEVRMVLLVKMVLMAESVMEVPGGRR
ncbi:hypothetical protein AF733_25190, partial [Salmonella enterica subsp. enterica]|nr:hypothetical protein [Salmonella enterica subsp. enterica]